MESSSRIEIEKFNGLNFVLWNIKMEDLFLDREQWIVVDPRTISMRRLKEHWEKLERKVMRKI
jgi:hypothetical protein